jgi:hypothetical protein
MDDKMANWSSIQEQSKEDVFTKAEEIYFGFSS